ncbi:MAG: hypothetical protein FJZ63_01155 [Chlamydiae bacterium]|nr:hypothetical protein [Chlamydiota bacterium]
MASSPAFPQTLCDIKNYVKVAQCIGAAPTLGTKIVFSLFSTVTEAFASLHPFFVTTPLTHMQNFGKSRKEQNSNFNVAAYTTATLMTAIVVYSLAAHHLYLLSASFLVKGIIAGVHGVAMYFFAYAKSHTSTTSFSSLKDQLRTIFWTQHALDKLRTTGGTQLKTLEDYSELLSMISFAVTNVAFTYFTQNAIIGQAVAYSAAAATNAISFRLLSAFTL